MTLLTRLNPYTHVIKLAAWALLGVSLIASGWVVNGWRLGKQIAEFETQVAKKEAARQSALTDRQQDAMREALEAVLRVQAALEAARKDNTRLVREAAQRAPTAPEYACRDIPLPEDYLEGFRL